MEIGIISGASSGIGRAIAKELDSLGFDELWLIGRNAEKLDALKSELKCHSRLFILDLSDNASFEALVSALSTGEYRIKCLVSSAGIGYTGTVESNTAKQISNMIDVNCRGLTLLINTALPFMCDGGKIVNIASGAGFLPQPDFAVYAATKSYVIRLSQALRKELKSKKINVCAACPGPVDTEFFANLENLKEYKRKYLICPERVAKGVIKAVNKNKAIYCPTLSMKLLRLGTKLLPTSLLLKFAK